VPFDASAFSHFWKAVDRRRLSSLVATHDGNRGVGEGARSWTCQRHLKALVYAQLSGLDSLREIEAGLAACGSRLYHLGLRPACRSTLSDALARRPAAVFRDLAQHLAGQAVRTLRREAAAVVELIDATPIPLRDARLTWPEQDSRVRGLKLFMHYDPAIAAPICFQLASPRLSDPAYARTLPLAPGTTYVFDKGFADYAWWQAIVEADARFVTRLKRNARRRPLPPAGADRNETRSVPGHGAILADRPVTVGHRQPRGGARNPLVDTPLREIVVERPGKTPLHLVTNDAERPAEAIADLYRQRWQIELFFKWLKQRLKIRRFLGRSENAVKTQLFAALITFLLLRLLKHTVARAHHGSLKNLADRLKSAALLPLNLGKHCKPPPTPPHRLPSSSQLELRLMQA